MLQFYTFVYEHHYKWMTCTQQIDKTLWQGNSTEIWERVEKAVSFLGRNAKNFFSTFHRQKKQMNLKGANTSDLYVDIVVYSVRTCRTKYYTSWNETWKTLILRLKGNMLRYNLPTSWYWNTFNSIESWMVGANLCPAILYYYLMLLLNLLIRLWWLLGLMLLISHWTRWRQLSSVSNGNPS